LFAFLIPAAVAAATSSFLLMLFMCFKFIL